MRILDTAIYTDKLDEVRAFYERHFYFPMDAGSPGVFGIMPFAEARITFIDAAPAGAHPSQGAVVRLGASYPQLERARLLAAGIDCSEMIVEDWGAFYGRAVQYFSVTDPSGTRLLFFEDHHGEAKQIITIGDGTGTRDVQR